MNTRYTLALMLALDAASRALGVAESTEHRLDYITACTDRAYGAQYEVIVGAYRGTDHIHDGGTPGWAQFHAGRAAEKAAREAAHEAAQRVIVYEALAAE